MLGMKEGSQCRLLQKENAAEASMAKSLISLDEANFSAAFLICPGCCGQCVILKVPDPIGCGAVCSLVE